MNLAEAAAAADALAGKGGAERELADLRAQWADELEAAARSSDYRQRAVAYRAIGQFRFRQKLELLRRGLEDESPACRGSALVSLELLSRGHPRPVNDVRPLLHTLANADDNQAVRRLALVCLRNGSPQRDTIVLLEHLVRGRRRGAGAARDGQARRPGAAEALVDALATARQLQTDGLTTARRARSLAASPLEHALLEPALDHQVADPGRDREERRAVGRGSSTGVLAPRRLAQTSPSRAWGWALK